MVSATVVVQKSICGRHGGVIWMPLEFLCRNSKRNPQLQDVILKGFFLFPSITQVLTLVELISNNSTSNHRGLTRNIHVYVVRLNCSVRACPWHCSLLVLSTWHEAWKIVRHCLILIESSNKFFWLTEICWRPASAARLFVKENLQS